MDVHGIGILWLEFGLGASLEELEELLIGEMVELVEMVVLMSALNGV